MATGQQRFFISKIKKGGSMSEEEFEWCIEQIEWIHSQLSEFRNGAEVDLEALQHFVEDIREQFNIEEEV